MDLVPCQGKFIMKKTKQALVVLAHISYYDKSDISVYRVAPIAVVLNRGEEFHPREKFHEFRGGISSL